MGSILSSRRLDNGKVVYEVCLDYEEIMQLRGHMDGVYLFSDNVADFKTRISGRGKNEATKYFLIPKQLRKDLKLNAKISCQRLETKTKVVFIYTIDKY